MILTEIKYVKWFWKRVKFFDSAFVCLALVAGQRYDKIADLLKLIYIYMLYV